MSEKILAMVSGMPITEGDVDKFIAGLGQRGASFNNPQGRKRVLEQLINSKLLLLDAQRNLYEAEAAFRAQLAALKEELLVNYAVEKAISAVNVTEADIQKYYEENKAQFVAPESVNASHILVDTEERANEILADINAGKISFEDAARENSSCPSKANGGSLGDFGRGQMVPEFDTAVFEMNEGEISAAPVKTQFGYHLIKLNKKNPETVMALEAIHDELYNTLINEKRHSAYESKINQLKIVYPVDLMTL